MLGPAWVWHPDTLTVHGMMGECYAPCRSRPGPEFGSVGFGVRADVASASGSLRRLVFRVQVLVAVKGLTRGVTVSRAEGQGGYECRVEIYFTAMLFDN